MIINVILLIPPLLLVIPIPNRKNVVNLHEHVTLTVGIRAKNRHVQVFVGLDTVMERKAMRLFE